ncbi:MAG: signal recognition particle receptor subunit alpha [Candidatus Diapherotrites archaeon]|nr:signal recognition particle receptor subunit alpha [Candidatus Diapherotrites archaeon]
MALGEKLRAAMERLKNAAFLDKDAIAEAVKEIQRALISSDVEVNLVFNLSREIEKKASEVPPKGIDRREFIIKTTYDLLADLIGGQHEAPKEPKKILLLGLFGQGKTTTAGKLAAWHKKRGRHVSLVCADVHRPASFEQLQQVAGQAGVEFYGIKAEKSAVKIVQSALQELKKQDLVIVDSAGRSGLDEALIKEIIDVKAAFNPDQIWLVLSADIGQLAKRQAQAFHEAVGVNGIILSKADSSSKGGGALAACAETRAPVYFIGTGEKLSDLEIFDAKRYLGRIMGYGDLEALLEKAKEAAEEKDFKPEDILSGDFNLDVFYKQLEATKKMGPISKVAEMMGLKMQLPKEQLELGQEKLDSYKIIMDSMTKQEKKHPDIISRERIERIAKGSGRRPEDVRDLLKQYRQLEKMLGKFKKIAGKKDPEKMDEKDIQKMMQKFGGMRKKKRLKFR